MNLNVASGRQIKETHRASALPDLKVLSVPLVVPQANRAFTEGGLWRCGWWPFGRFWFQSPQTFPTNLVFRHPHAHTARPANSTGTERFGTNERKLPRRVNGTTNSGRNFECVHFTTLDQKFRENSKNTNLCDIDSANFGPRWSRVRLHVESNQLGMFFQTDRSEAFGQKHPFDSLHCF